MNRSIPVLSLIVSMFACFGLLPAQIPVGGAPDNFDWLRFGPVGDDASPISSPLLFPRDNYSWPYATGPYYGDVPLPSRFSPKVMRSAVGSFELGSGELPFPRELTARVHVHETGAQYFIVHSDPKAASFDGQARDLELLGSSIVERVDRGTVVARLAAPMYAALAGSPDVSLLEPYHPALKLHPRIGRDPLPDPVKALSEVYELDVTLWPGEQASEVIELVGKLGGTARRSGFERVRVELHRSQLQRLAAIESVRMVYEHLPVFLHGEETTTTVQTGEYNEGAVPFHDAELTGRGGKYCDDANFGTASATPCEIDADCAPDTCERAEQILMVLDSGIQLDAAELSDTRVSAGSPGPTHRKVLVYQSVAPYFGVGDLAGCDAPAQGGYTHGHMVAATALGQATHVSGAYGTGWDAFDRHGNAWSLDGLAPDARLIAYDAQITPPVGACGDPQEGDLVPGDLYDPSAPLSSSLGAAYQSGARVFNLSWGVTSNVYNADSTDVDRFMSDEADALVVVSVGNRGSDLDPPGGDGVPDAQTMGAPATSKNALAVGASRNADRFGAAGGREFFSATGPAVNDTTVNRIAPQVMAPGGERGGGSMGISSEFACRSGDNDLADPVECDVAEGREGTSFAAAATSGAAMLVRDYFSQGFYPRGRPVSANQVPTVSGALVKGVLVASADFMNGLNLTHGYRWNNEQGAGRVQLDNALPLESWPRSPTGMLVHDTLDGNINVSTLSLPGSLSSAGSAGANFEVCSDTEELRIVLAWTDLQGDALENNLDLQVTSPSGKVYKGNYYTDDNNRNGFLDGAPPEDCPGIGEQAPNGRIDQGPWSLPTCANSRVPGFSNNPQLFDETNVIETIMLSPDPDGNGNFHDGVCSPASSDPGGLDGLGTCGNDLDCAITPSSPLPNDECLGGTQQPEIGRWTITVAAGTPFGGSPQDFAVVITGGACLGASVRFDQESYTCNERVRVTVNELTPAAAWQVTDRTTIRVLHPVSFVEFDCEGLGCAVNPVSLPTFLQPDPDELIFESPPIVSTDSNGPPVFGGGQIDVRDGYLIEVTYDDGTTPVTSTARVDCRLDLDAGSVVFSKFGRDGIFFVNGGCERAVPRHERCDNGACAGSGAPCNEDVDCPREPQGYFDYGFPDQYLDADELIHYHFAFNADETIQLANLWANLRCVEVDQDSPPTCKPNGDGCQPGEDAERSNNNSCPWMTILDTPKRLGFIPAGAALSANFTIQMADTSVFAGATPTVELLLEGWDDVSGMTAGLLVSRHRLNVDPVEFHYSTDFPAGGVQVEVRDYDNNEREQNPVSVPGVGVRGDDYRFETLSFSDMTATGRNLNLMSPWNFDANDGGFTHGLAAATDRAAASIYNITNWGDDRNFNRIEDGTCRFDPSIACYSFSFDARCPGPGNCDSAEAPATGTFQGNWSTLGGCGWQTRAPHTCTANPIRTCFTDDDCLGECRLIGNQLLSTFSPCSGPSGCPPVLQCNPGTSTTNILGPCLSDIDCGGASGSCQAVTQTCQGFDGTCDLASFNQTGGIWHTGTIGALGQPCPDECEPYDLFPTTGGHLMWWELLLTPVMEKVNQAVGPYGEPEAQAEITRWAWNQSIDLADEFAGITWEFDTDLESAQEADLINDVDVLGINLGPYGSLSGANVSQLTDGYGLFAPMATCSLNGAPCVKDRDCPPGFCSLDQSVECYVDFECITLGLGTCVGAEHCVWTGVNSNGTDSFGNNRVGRNACTFLGTAIPPDARDRIALAGPPDDDRDNDADGIPDEFVSAHGPLRNWNISAFNGPDMRDLILEDIYGDTGNTFQGAIGIVNFEGRPGDPAAESYGLGVDDVVVEWKEITLDLDQTSCAGGACATIELTTTNFFEGTAVAKISVLDPTPYGSVCFGGPSHGGVCFPAQANSCPGGGVCTPLAVNDCNMNGNYLDGFDSDDCSNPQDGIQDVVVLATSDAEVAGEKVVLNRTHPTSNEYRGEVPVSLWNDNPGVLFLDVLGDRSPTVHVRYFDAEDGTGNPCQDDVLAEHQGWVQTGSTLFAETCDVGIVDYLLQDNGDGDGIADTSERVDLEVLLHNRSGRDLDHCMASLYTDSPHIKYIQNRTVFVGALPADAQVPIPVPFLFRVEDTADRTSSGLTADDELSARFKLTLVCSDCEATSIPQVLDLQLDLNLWDLKQSPTDWIEDFSTGTLGKFIPEDLDHGLPGTSDPAGLANADGWRCQYSDPERPGSNSYGTAAAADCYPGMNVAQSIAVYWQPDGTTTGSPDGGRAKSDNHSMYYGQYLPSGFTTPMSVVESVRSTPINLGVDDPSFSFWQQISLSDYRSLGSITPRRSADRAVVQIRRLDSSSQPASPWTTLRPIQNGYDEQAADFYMNCSFDPLDDGTTEEDFFDPSAPRLGPSSTCFPAMTFGYMGDTAGSFDPSSVGHATTAPRSTDAPSLGVGTWVESKFDVSQYRGRQVELRFLVSALKSTAESWEELFEHDPTSTDDGWWIDDVVVEETLATPAEVWNDDFQLGSCNISGQACIAQCRRTSVISCTNNAQCPLNEDCVAPCPSGEVCNQPPPPAPGGPRADDCTFAEANVFVTPAEEWNPSSVDVPAPGQAVYFDAASPAGPSFADACLNGTLRFRHCISADPDGLGPQPPDEDCNDADDLILRGWTDDPTAAVAPFKSSSYVLEVRCSTAHECMDSRKVDLIVGCGDRQNGLPLLEIGAVSKTTLAWTEPLEVDWLKGDFATSADVGSYIASFYHHGAGIDSIPMKGTPAGSGADIPAPGSGWYYLVKVDGSITPTNEGVYCNSVTWRSGGAKEETEPARDAFFGDPTP